MNAEKEQVLTTLFNHRRHGWISGLTQAGVPSEDLAYLEWLADAEDNFERQSSKVQREYDANEELYELCKEIMQIEMKHDAMTKQDRPYLEKALYLISTEYGDRKKLRDRLQAHYRHHDLQADDVTDQDIEKARNFPLEELVQLGRDKKTKCPFADHGKPQLYVRNGFGYCFACGEWTDSIKYLMFTKNLTFLEVVRGLR